MSKRHKITVDCEGKVALLQAACACESVDEIQQEFGHVVRSTPIPGFKQQNVEESLTQRGLSTMLASLSEYFTPRTNLG